MLPEYSRRLRGQDVSPPRRRQVIAVHFGAWVSPRACGIRCRCSPTSRRKHHERIRHGPAVRRRHRRFQRHRLELAQEFAEHDFDLMIAAEDAASRRPPPAAPRRRADGRGGPGGPRHPRRRRGALPAHRGRRAAGGRDRDQRRASAPAATSPRHDLGDELDIVDLNVRSTVHLAKRVRARHGRPRRRAGAVHLVDRAHDARLLRGGLQRRPSRSCSRSRRRCATSSRTAASRSPR